MMSEQKYVYLNPWDEAIGHLLDVKDSSLIYCDFTLLIEPEHFDSIRYIESLVGDFVSVLRTDIQGSEYIVTSHTQSNVERGSPHARTGHASHRDKEAAGKVPNGRLIDGKNE